MVNSPKALFLVARGIGSQVLASHLLQVQPPLTTRWMLFQTSFALPKKRR